MARFEVNDPKMRDFARWLVANLNKKDKALIQTMHAVFKDYRADVFETAVKNKAPRYARLTEGSVLMTRREHYDAATATVAAMLHTGEIELPADLPSASTSANSTSAN